MFDLYSAQPVLSGHLAIPQGNVLTMLNTSLPRLYKCPISGSFVVGLKRQHNILIYSKQEGERCSKCPCVYEAKLLDPEKVLLG